MTVRAELHRNLLNSYSQDAAVIPLIEMWPDVESAIEDVIATGDYDSYVARIEPYDRWIWEQSRQPRGSNPVAWPQWKIYPSWAELNWALVYERVRQQTPYDTQLIRTGKVVESATTDGTVTFKDVDGGLSIKGQLDSRSVQFPVVVMEHKSGHFDKPLCQGVNAMAQRFHKTNPNVITVQITENNITVNRNQTMQVINEIDIFIVDRGHNQKNRDQWWARNSQEMRQHELHLVELLNTTTREHFSQICRESSELPSFRDSLDRENYLAKTKHFVQ
tara:strand:- start:323 stop:1150 length:828 start_codon:yes stop_codon:yes gene_type:complete